jgi:two-component system, OmpR family, osmolarity sensor histidine kinase EnvZ
MLKSLRARNVALMAGMLFLGQLLTMILVGAFVIEPQAQRIATILSRNIKMVGTTLDALPAPERARFVDRVNSTGTYRILPGHGDPPGVDGRPTWLETRVLRALASELGQRDSMVWRGGGGAPLWVRLRLGKGDSYWVSLAPSPGWTPTGALLGSVGIALALSLAAGLALQRRINRPLTALAVAVDAMPDTRPVGSLAAEGPAEIASVARAFERMAARLSAQEADRAFMLAGISHDLKTPIAKLRLASALRENGDAADDAMIARQFDRIERMLDQFLDFGRGADAEAPQPVNVRAVIVDVLTSLGLSAKNLDGGAVQARLRPVAFERAIANLVRNALAHGQEPVTVSIAELGAHVTIAVADSGSGVAPDLLHQLGRPFLRGDAARPSDGGVGLGLAIVKRFADDHGGALVIVNLQSGGLCVTLTVPKTGF